MSLQEPQRPRLNKIPLLRIPFDKEMQMKFYVWPEWFHSLQISKKYIKSITGAISLFMNLLNNYLFNGKGIFFRIK